MVLIQSCRRVGLKVKRKPAGCANQIRDQEVMEGIGPGRVRVIMSQPKAGQERKRKNEQKRTSILARLELFAPVVSQFPDCEGKEHRQNHNEFILSHPNGGDDRPRKIVKQGVERDTHPDSKNPPLDCVKSPPKIGHGQDRPTRNY